MRVLRVGVVALAAVLAACERIQESPTGPVSLSSSASGPAVTGSGHVPSGAGLREFTFHAKQKPDGSVSGSYKIEFTATGLFLQVDVTCVAVEGNTGWVGGRIVESNIAAVIIGSVSYFYAIDNGEGQGSPPDRVSSARINDVDGEDLRFCAERPLLLPSFNITNGNVQVR